MMLTTNLTGPILSIRRLQTEDLKAHNLKEKNFFKFSNCLVQTIILIRRTAWIHSKSEQKRTRARERASERANAILKMGIAQKHIQPQM